MCVRIALPFLAGVGLLFTSAGCSGDPNMPKLGKVHGTVTYKGKPVDSGTVTFNPIPGKGGETGQNATGEIESDGSYEMTTFNTGNGASSVSTSSPWWSARRGTRTMVSPSLTVRTITSCPRS